MTVQSDMSSRVPPFRPELMSPAGDWDCAKAAVENGADAIYFGLQGGFNARARAVNFTTAELPELMTFLRSRGIKGYLTLNTLVFPDELEEAEQTARSAIAAGVDAVLVQDLGMLRLIHQLCPEMPLHASTQMTLASAECIQEVESLGVRRVVLPRELSLAEIAEIRSQTSVELEVFVHGALCVSYSGQCLASLSLGGRSANRGQCAQPCRLPYELVCDAQRFDLGEKKYLLSPHDLAAYDRLPELIASGVSALKIEGRMKTAEYVAGVTAFYRKAIDAICEGRPAVADPMEVAELEVAFSRGFGHGWLDGNDHPSLVSGLSSSKRGILLGTVEAILGSRVRVRLSAPVRRGDGVVFEGDRTEQAEQGGRVYEIFRDGYPLDEALEGSAELAFGHDALDTNKLRPGQSLWKTDDPKLERRLRKTFSGAPQRSMPLAVTVEAAVGSPLRITAVAANAGTCHVESPTPLVEAVKHELTAEVLEQQLGRLGKTPYRLGRLDARIIGRPMIPLSVLGKMRHEMIEQLDALTARPPVRTMAAESVLPALRNDMGAMGSLPSHPAPLPTTLRSVPAVEGSGGLGATAGLSRSAGDTVATNQAIAPHLHVLCRSIEQVELALECGVSSVVADFRNLADCGEAVRLARRRFIPVLLATPRIHRPGENGVLQRLADFGPDGLLVRNLAGLAFGREQKLTTVADFSLNAVNELTVQWLHDIGAARVTASYDVSVERLLNLAAVVPPEWLEIVVYSHMPMFHSSHCLFSSRLSSGGNRADCGRPCERHALRLRDRLGVEHPLSADSQCRNTVFHAQPTSLVESVAKLLQRGVRHYRLELLAGAKPAEMQRAIETVRSRSGASRFE